MVIGLFDSGTGGKTVEAEIKKLLPTARIIYLADTVNFPYGDKSPAELKNICRANVQSLLAQGANLIVIACNTATAATIDYLRAEFSSLPIVGTEPAIKQACQSSSPDAQILLLATTSTARSSRTRELIQSYKLPAQTVTVQACPGLADAIEAQDVAKIDAILSALNNPPKQIETVVLGCTHYPLIHQEIQAYFPGARLIDGSPGVAREVARLAKTLKL